MQKKRILTGDRPTGKLHLGHYVGSLRQRLELQDTYEQFVLIADVQALTDNFDDTEKVQESVIELMLDYLAVGLDPAKTTFYLQSRIPATAELFVYFLNLYSVEESERNPTVKAEIAQKKNTKKSFKESVPLGFFVYPVHQAADIMTVNAHLVPVGEEQLPMIETTRTIVKRFNRLYKTDLFNIPEARLTEFSRLPGIDGKAKMSKSLNNAIYLSDDEKTLKGKVFSMYTDPNRVRVTDPGTIENNPVFVYHDAFNTNKSEVEDLKARYRNGKVGDIEVKEKLFAALNAFLSPIREKREHYEADRDKAFEVLMEGTTKVKGLSEDILSEAKKAMRITYSS